MNKILENTIIYIFSFTILSIFLGAIIYCARQVNENTSIPELLFWSALMLLFISQIQRGLNSMFVKEKEGDQDE